MPNLKYTIASSVYYMRLILTYLIVKKIECNISTSEMLQKETKKSYYTLPNDIAFAKLRTCACFPLPVYPSLQTQLYEPIVLLHCAFT